MKYHLKFLWLMPGILEIKWPESMELPLLLDMRILEKKLKLLWGKKIREMVFGYHTMAICFRDKINKEEIPNQIREAYSSVSPEWTLDRKRWYVPVCYAPEHAKDLTTVANSLGLELEQLIQLHTKNPYLLYFFGFLPGFMYLGGLNEKLYLPRKNLPDPRISEGSVAIGGKQTGIYPTNSPGGWHIIGKTPVKLFNRESKNPVFACPLDEIQFYSIDSQTFRRLIIKNDPILYLPENEKIER